MTERDIHALNSQALVEGLYEDNAMLRSLLQVKQVELAGTQRALELARKGQPHHHSLAESFANTAVGFAISVASVAWLFPLVGVHTTLGENLSITGIMTVVSIARSYVLRRLFNGFHSNAHH